MNAQDYISSGLLEAYVLGALAEAEYEQVAGAICRFPEVAAEVSMLEEDMFRTAELAAVAPPPALQDQIWTAIAQQPERMSVQTPASGPKSVPLPPPAAAAPSIQPAHRRRFPVGMAAAVALLIGSVAANVVIYNNGKEREVQLQALNSRLQSDIQTREVGLAQLRQQYESESAMAADPAMQTIAMRSLQADKPMAATVYWNASAQKAFVSVKKLPPPPAGMQYQLWALADGKPVSLGMIDNAVATESGMQPVELPVAAGQAFAVSLEQAGGVPSPTAERIMLMGKVPA